MSNPASMASTVSAEEVRETAVDAYVYAYPIVLMELTRRISTNAGEGAPPSSQGAPVNQFHHMRTFPDATFTQVVRPNADTLYSAAFFDVGKEPLVIDVPSSGGRYYLLPMLDYWTDVFASPGKRTTGTGAQTFAICGQGWNGNLPEGVRAIKAPTAQGWIIGRTQTNGEADFSAVHEFQDGLKAVPMSNWGRPYTPAKAKFDSKQDMSAPAKQLERLDAAAFFRIFTELTKANPPHAHDYPILERMVRIGLAPGQPFDPAKASAETKAALDDSVRAGQAKIRAYFEQSSKHVNGWSMLLNPIGTYGSDYLKRALVAYMGLGANVIEDAFYPTAHGQADGKPFDSGARYTMHFKKQDVPPTRAFWSLTMYNDKQFFAGNPINRYAIGDRDPLQFNGDGSLDLYIQRESPGKDKETNWLPAPSAGSFSMNLRLYWPKPEAVDGTWQPPMVRRVE